MRKTPRRHARLAAALMLSLALPLAAQSPETATEEGTEASEAVDATGADPTVDPAATDAPGEADAAAEATEAGASDEAAPAAPADPALLDAEQLPRASRSLLLDAVRTNAGYFAVGERGHVIVSEDGQAWTQAAIPTRSTLTAITAFDGVLWAAGHDGVIVHSTDGGQTWTRRRAAPWSLDLVDPSEGVPVLDLLFTDNLNGFAIGAYSLMLVTRDGGVSWEPRSIAADAPVEDDPAAEDAGAAEGDDWTFDAADLELEAESDPHLNAIARTESGALVIAGERGAFFRSRDGGETWESKRLPYEGSMFGILTWGDSRLLAFGLRGNVLESTDLGDTWTAIDTGTTTSLMGGHALPDGGAILVGGNGLVLVRQDGDSPFVRGEYETASGETASLAGVIPAADGAYLVVGDRGAGLYRAK